MRTLIAIAAYAAVVFFGDEYLGLGGSYGVSMLSGTANISFKALFVACVLSVIGGLILRILDGKEKIATAIAGAFWGLPLLWDCLGYAFNIFKGILKVLTLDISDGLVLIIKQIMEFFVLSLEDLIMLMGVMILGGIDTTSKEEQSSPTDEDTPHNDEDTSKDGNGVSK